MIAEHARTIRIELEAGGALELADAGALDELADAADAAGFAILADALTATADAVRLELDVRTVAGRRLELEAGIRAARAELAAVERLELEDAAS